MVNNLEDTYYNKFINFFDSHNLYNKKIFDEIWERCSFFDYLEDEYRDFIGVYYIFDKNKKLLDFNLIVPFIDSKKTLLINIHEFVHAIYAYYNLGKKFILDDSSEASSLFFENIYVLENYDEEINKFFNSLNRDRINSNEDRYILGLKIADELLKKYNKDVNLNTLSKKSKILMKKHKYQK